MSKLFSLGQSGNPTGRPKGAKASILTTRGRLERFMARNMSARAMQALYNKLSPKDQMEFLTALLPYSLPKVTTDSLTADDIDKIYEEVMKAMEANKLTTNGKAI